MEAADSAPVPTALTARTTKLYAVPLVRPVTTVLVAVPVGLTVRCTVVPVRTSTWYPVIADPPSLAGAVQLRVTDASPAAAVTAVGAPGAVVAAGAAGMVWSENRSCSAFLTVSAPSACVPRAWTTVTDVGPKVMSYSARAPENSAVSMDVPLPGVRISRTMRSCPGLISPDRTRA